jgi:phage tail tape-measure protein
MTSLVKAKNISGRALCLSVGTVLPDGEIEVFRAEAIALGAYLSIEDGEQGAEENEGEGLEGTEENSAKGPVKGPAKGAHKGAAKEEALNPEDL